MRSFASDNNATVHPKIMQAIAEANINHAVGYGDDPWSEKAMGLLKKEFGEQSDVFFVFNGTGANSVALQALTHSFDAIIAPATGHICVDECGSPSFMTGARIFEVATEDGKLTPELIKSRIVGQGVVHHSQPRVVSISQCTELGTIYTIEQVREIAELVHSQGMYLHMDGARLANACAALGCSMKEITLDAGVDILSLGGTKNGMMIGEAVISFNKEASKNLGYIRKQSAQLCSKMRFLACQFIPYFEEDLWLINARQANSMTQELAQRLSEFECVKFTQKVESNAIFAQLPRELIDKLQQSYFFYEWNAEKCEVRFVTSWDTQLSDIEEFTECLRSNINSL